MRVPLTTRDFLDRAELVYGDRVGIVDEPVQPAPSLGEVTYRELNSAAALTVALAALAKGGHLRVGMEDTLTYAPGEPVRDNTQLVARAAGRLTGIARGLDVKAVSAPEVGFAEFGAEAYAQALAGYASGTETGVAGWLVHCCRATEHGATEGLAICESLLRG